jgi:hypothetical protein
MSRAPQIQPELRPPHVVFCEVYGACHALYATRTGWTAAEVLRTSLALYLVRQGFRRGYYVPGGPWASEQLELLAQKLTPLQVCASQRGPIITNSPLGPTEENPTGAVFQDGGDDAGAMTWLCSLGSSDLELWSEKLPRDASFSKIEPHVQQIKVLLGQLGYTACVRVE